MILLIAVLGYLAYHYVATRPGAAGWIGGAIFSGIAAVLLFYVVRSAAVQSRRAMR
jgi:hypothetical protein